MTTKNPKQQQEQQEQQPRRQGTLDAIMPSWENLCCIVGGTVFITLNIK
jgi:hypothetical protein